MGLLGARVPCDRPDAQCPIGVSVVLVGVEQAIHPGLHVRVGANDQHVAIARDIDHPVKGAGNGLIHRAVDPSRHRIDEFDVRLVGVIEEADDVARRWAR